MSTTTPQPTEIPFAPIKEKLRESIEQYKKNSVEDWVKYDTYTNILNQIGTQEFLNKENLNKTLQEQGYENIGYQRLTLLKIAILFGSEDAVKTLLEYGASINIPDPQDENGWGGYTELHWAAFSGNAKIAQMLVESGANIHIMATDNFTPLHIAAARGHIEVAKLLIDEGADINVKMWSHKTPLHFAVANNDMEMVKYLLSKHADVNAQDKDGNTPLHDAITSNNIDMVQILVASGANATIQNFDGQTPQDIAISHQYSELVEYLSPVEEVLAKTIGDDIAPETPEAVMPGQGAFEEVGDH